MKSRILVTGGAGYIGSHTSKSLAANGFEPICYDNFSTGHREFVKWGPLEVGNLHDTTLLVKIMQKYKLKIFEYKKIKDTWEFEFDPYDTD
jgi:UDP-glucose 4-epimerase